MENFPETTRTNIHLIFAEDNFAKSDDRKLQKFCIFREKKADFCKVHLKLVKNFHAAVMLR